MNIEAIIKKMLKGEELSEAEKNVFTGLQRSRPNR